MQDLYERHGVEQGRKARQGKAREKGSRMKDNVQMRGTQASPCLSKCDVSKAACILGDPKLLAAEIQDVLVTSLAVFVQSFTSLLLIVMVGDKGHSARWAIILLDLLLKNILPRPKHKQTRKKTPVDYKFLLCFCTGILEKEEF